MRLGKRAVEVFTLVLGRRIKGRPAKLYLFGSRAQDRLKGGDIDLLLLAPAGVVKDLRGEKHALLAELKKQLGDQRIDLVLAGSAQARRDPFVRRSLQTAVLLKRWHSRPSRAMKGRHSKLGGF